MNFKSYLQKKQSSTKTIKSHVYNVCSFESWLMDQGISVEIVDQSDVLSYLQYCKSKGNSNRTLSHYLNSLRKYFTFLETKPNPCLHLQIKGITKRLPVGLLSENELNYLHESYPEKTIHEQRDKMILSLLIYQGITTAEIIELEQRDVHLEIGIIEIRLSKKGQYRKLKLMDHQIIELGNYINQIRPKLETESTDQLLINSGTSERKDNDPRLNEAIEKPT